MKPHELRELPLDELKKRLSEERESLSNLEFQLATSQLESPIKVRTARREVARISTIINEKSKARKE